MYCLSTIMLQRNFRERNLAMSGEAVPLCKLNTTPGMTKMSKLWRLLTRQWFQGQSSIWDQVVVSNGIAFSKSFNICKFWLNSTLHFLDFFSQAFEHLQNKSHGYPDWCPQVPIFWALLSPQCYSIKASLLNFFGWIHFESPIGRYTSCFPVSLLPASHRKSLSPITKRKESLNYEFPLIHDKYICIQLYSPFC